MGGRGSGTQGKTGVQLYQTVGYIAGVKVLEGKPGSGKHNLPEESFTGRAYIRLDRNGNFYQYRSYGKDHYLRFEIGYHSERSIDPSGKPVLHIHYYDKNFNRTKGRLLTLKEFKRYKKYFKGVM